MTTRRSPSSRLLGAVGAWAVLAASAWAGEPAVAQAPAEAKASPGAPLPPPKAAAPARPALLREIERLAGTEVHGRLTTKWESRWVRGDLDESDHDVYGLLDVRVGDGERDAFSGALLVRSAWDLDQPDDRLPGRTYSSLADTFDDELSTLLYTAYGQWRPKAGKVETFRAGRQFVDVAETFHVDGVAVRSRALDAATNLRVTAYGGVPVHFYEEGSSGDWLAGFQATADLRKGTRAALDYAHVQDELSGFGEQRNDFAALQVWQRVGEHTEAHGRLTWLEGARDVRLRVTHLLPEHDLLLQATYKHLFEDQSLRATEFDPYVSVLRTYHAYDQGELRAVKGFGDRWQVEAGASARELADQHDVGPFNRETRRVWLTPSVDDFPWKGATLTAGVESWSGDGQRIRTWTADLGHRFSKDLRVAAGSDFSLYDYGRLSRGERAHVRTVWLRADARLTDKVSLGLRATRERDEEETYHAVSLSLSVDF
jgi:hypothetical protein